MKTILLWDPRFPERAPDRLRVAHEIASAAVRAGVAAAANPAEHTQLATGAALDRDLVTEVVMETGSGRLARVTLPFSVVMVGAQLGKLAVIGKPVKVTPGPVPTPTPTPPSALAHLLDGTAGNHVCWPQSFVFAGTSRLAHGAVKASGAQVVYHWDYATDALQEEFAVRTSSDPQDDHNIPSGGQFADGGSIWAATGHNTSHNSSIVYRAPDGTLRRSTLSYGTGNRLTYLGVFVDRTERVWLNVREDNEAWSMRWSDDRGLTWSPRQIYLRRPNAQIYGYVRYDPAGHKFYGWGRYNSADPSFGVLKPFELDCATGEWSDGSGPLGTFTGPSANGKALPFDLDGIQSLDSPPAGYFYDVLEHMEDGRRAVILLVKSGGKESDWADTEIQHWQCPGPADRYTLAAYVRTPITNFGARLAYGGFNGVPNLSYDRASGVAGTRLFINRKIAVTDVTNPSGPKLGRWVLEQWDDADGDGANWASQRLMQGTEAYDSMARPLGAYAATPATPISVSRMRSITEYDRITDARVEFMRTAQGRAGFREEPETAAFVASLSPAPTALERALINTAFRDLRVGGLLADAAAANAAVANALAGVFPASADASVDAVMRGFASDYAVETGRTVVAPPPSPPPPPQPADEPFLLDTFTAEQESDLNTHAPETGAAPVRHPVFPNGQILIGPDGVTYSPAQPAQYLYPAAPPSADYRVDATFKRLGAGNNNVTVIARALEGEDRGYALGYNNGTNTLSLSRRASTSTTLASHPAGLVTGGEAVSTLTLQGDQLTWEVNGVVIGTYTDSTFPEPGRVAVRHSSANNTPTTGGALTRVAASPLA